MFLLRLVDRGEPCRRRLILNPVRQIADAPTWYGVDHDQLPRQTAGLLRTHGLRDASRRLLAPFGGAIEHDTGTSPSLETAVALVLEQPDGNPSTVVIPGSQESAGAVLRRNRNPELLERLVRADRPAAARAVALDDTINPYDDSPLPRKTHRAMNLAVIAAAEQRSAGQPAVWSYHRALVGVGSTHSWESLPTSA